MASWIKIHSFQDLGAEVNCYLRGKNDRSLEQKGLNFPAIHRKPNSGKGNAIRMEAQRNEFKQNESTSYSGRYFLRCAVMYVKKSCGGEEGKGNLQSCAWE